MFGNKHKTQAKMRGKTLIISTLDAKEPGVWQSEVKRQAGNVFTIETEAGEYRLLYGKEVVAAYKTKESAAEALLSVSHALEKGRFSLLKLVLFLCK